MASGRAPALTGLAGGRTSAYPSRMKRPLVATAVAVLGACDPCGRCGPCGQPASQQKQGGYGGAANQVVRPQGRVPDPKSPPQDRGSGSGSVDLRGDAAPYYLYRHHLAADDPN